MESQIRWYKEKGHGTDIGASQTKVFQYFGGFLNCSCVCFWFQSFCVFYGGRFIRTSAWAFNTGLEPLQSDSCRTSAERRPGLPRLVRWGRLLGRAHMGIAKASHADEWNSIPTPQYFYPCRSSRGGQGWIWKLCCIIIFTAYNFHINIDEIRNIWKFRSVGEMLVVDGLILHIRAPRCRSPPGSWTSPSPSRALEWSGAGSQVINENADGEKCELHLEGRNTHRLLIVTPVNLEPEQGLNLKKMLPFDFGFGCTWKMGSSK